MGQDGPNFPAGKATKWPRLRTAYVTSLLMLLLTLPAVVQALDYTYTTKNGTITITKYAGSDGAVAIPDTIDGLPVTSIGDRAFFECSSITGVVIPNSVASIAYGAFSVCTSLTAITADAGNSFYSSVDGVLFDKSLTTLIQYPRGKAGSYTIPNSVTNIGEEAFIYCTNLTSVTIPNSVTSIGVAAFSYCTNLTNVTIPDSVTSIRSASFNGCTSLISLTIGTSVTSIEGSAFRNCASLTNVAIPNSVSSIKSYAFSGCTGLTSISVPIGVNNIENYTFSGCSGLTRATIPNSVANIGSSAFSSCTSLTSIEIPNGVISIGDLAFEYCTRLTSVTIPNSVTSIGYRAFSSCTSLTAIAVDALNSVFNSLDGVLYNRSLTTLIQCPAGKAGGYTIPNSVTDIGSWAFTGCASLTSVMIGTSVTSIRSGAFCGCTGLAAITANALNSVFNSMDGVLFNKSHTTLVQYPAGKAGSYTIPSSVTNIGSYAFTWCTSLTNVTIPASVTSIEDWAFSLCTSLTNVTIPNSVTSIGVWAFYRSTSLAAIQVDALNSFYSSVDGVLFDKSLTTLIEYPAGKAGSYTIPNSINHIGIYAFSGCTNLTSVTIPSSVHSIEVGVFSGCTGMTGVYFKGSVLIGGAYWLSGDDKATVYYLAGNTVRDQTDASYRIALWKPLMQTIDASFGVRTNQFGFNIAWSSGMVIVVESCTNLTIPSWVPLQTNTLSGDTFYFNDTQWTNYPSRFYRLRSP